MRINTLQPAEGSVKKTKRVGRGIGSGHGKMSTRGGKGQTARSGGRPRIAFEGGQMPLVRKIPKRGFTQRSKKVYATVNLEVLNNLDKGSVVTFDFLFEKGLVKEVKNNYGLKVLGKGKVAVALTVKADKFSVTAKKAIEKAGGTCEIVNSSKPEKKS